MIPTNLPPTPTSRYLRSQRHIGKALRKNHPKRLNRGQLKKVLPK